MSDKIKAIIISGSLVQDHEFIYPFYRLLEEDIEVDVCLLEGQPVKGYFGTAIPPNKNHQVKKIDDVNVKDYKITHKEEGAIPLFYQSKSNDLNKINIGTAGGMTRLSTGYTFLNIQEHSEYIRKNIENITNTKIFEIDKKYQFLDKIFLRVLEKNPEKMPNIFFKMFSGTPKTVIKFLSNKNNFIESLSIILKMPKWIFVKALFK